MRPNYYVTATDKDGHLILYGLYYNGNKARRALKLLQSQAPDGSHTISHEDGRLETAFGVSGNLSFEAGFLGDHISTKRAPWKKSFFDTSEEEFHELAAERGIPVKILLKIADHERDYVENRGDTRWNARKRAYLPRFLYNWI